VQRHFGPVSRNHFALHDADGLASRFGGIVDERVGVFARAQRAVGFVAAVGEGFGGDGEAGTVPLSRKSGGKTPGCPSPGRNCQEGRNGQNLPLPLKSFISPMNRLYENNCATVRFGHSIR